MDLTSLINSIVGGLLVALTNHLFTRRKVNAEADKLNAEAEKTRAETEKIKAETNKLSAEIQEIQDDRLVGEVIVNRHTQGADEQLYWVDEEGTAHLIEDQEVAAFMASRKGTIGVNPGQFDRLEKGSPFSVSKDSFCRIRGDYFLIVNGKAFWITSIGLVYKYWDDPKQVPEIELQQFRKYRVIR
jgi:hypothetical protein